MVLLFSVGQPGLRIKHYGIYGGSGGWEGVGWPGGVGAGGLGGGGAGGLGGGGAGGGGGESVDTTGPTRKRAIPTVA